MAAGMVTGLVVRASAIEWTVLRLEAGRWTPVKSGTYPLPAPSEGQDVFHDQANLALIEQALHAGLPRLPKPVRMALPASRALLRVLQLPHGTPEELHGMVRLQVEKFAPFPLDSLLVSHEVLATSPDGCLVLAAAAPAALVERWAGCLRNAGTPIQAVDLDVTAWWRLVKDAGLLPAEGRQAITVVDGAHSHLMFVRQGIPLVLRSLEIAETPDAADELAREWSYTIAAIGADPDEVPPHATVFHRGDEPAALASRLEEALGLTVECRALDPAPALSESVARRQADRETPPLDLAPLAWRDASRRRAAKARIIAATVVLLSLWLAAIALIFGGAQFQQHRLMSMEDTLAALKKPADQVRATQARVLALEQYLNRQYSALEALREVSDLLPPGIDLRSFVYRKGKTVEMAGEASAVTLVFDFKKEMDESEFFRGVDLPRTQRTSGGRESFRMTAKLPGGTE